MNLEQPPAIDDGNRRKTLPILLFLIALLFIMMLWIIMRYPLRINHDCALYLQTGGLLIEGNLPYVDFFDTNPPLIMYLNMVPALFAKILLINPVQAFGLFVWALCLFSTIAAGRLLRSIRPAWNPFAIAAIEWTWSFYSYLLLLHNGFGQREHLFALLFFPYFILRWVRYQGYRPGMAFSILLGALAATGACIKPHFLLIVFASELVWMIEYKTLSNLIRTETAGLVTAGLLYPLHFLFMPQAMTDAFFKRWLLFLQTRYEVFNNPLSYLFQWPFFILAGAFVFIILLSFFKNTFSPLLRSIAAVLGANLVIFLWQHKGWIYHLYPAFGFALVALGTQIGVGISAIKNKATFSATAIVAFLIALIPAAVGVYGDRFTQFREPGLVRLVEQHTQIGDAVIGIATTLDLNYPLMVQMERRPGSRYLHFFSIPMLYMDMEEGAATFPYRTSQTETLEEKRFLRELGEDIQRFEPRLILIVNRMYGMTTCPLCPAGFNLVEYFTKNGFIADAMGNYKVVIKGDLWGFVRNEVGPAQTCSPPLDTCTAAQ